MSVWELRQVIESHIPWWLVPALILAAGMTYSAWDFWRKKE